MDTPSVTRIAHYLPQYDFNHPVRQMKNLKKEGVYLYEGMTSSANFLIASKKTSLGKPVM